LNRFLLKRLRAEKGPMALSALETLAVNDGFAARAVYAVLAELCMSGPVVAIDLGGECVYALEWGVKASWENN
jgi:hypothetical protein